MNGIMGPSPTVPTHWKINKMTTNLIHGKDTDGDGVLNTNEIGLPEKVFARIDRSEDGQADRSELNAAFVRRARLNHKTTELIENNDADGDGVLNADEMDVPDRVFARIDRNDDGQANRGELNAAFVHRTRLNHRTTELIENRDVNGDGVLNADEMSVPEKVFTKIDRSGDGQLDGSELNAALVAKRYLSAL